VAKEKILIVEDEADIQEMIRYNLEKEGFKTITVAKGEDAIRVVEKESPDLIILDLMLPGIDGLEVCRILRGRYDIVQTPIIMLTAKSQEADKVVGLELGSDDYMTKPFSPRELIARIKAILRRTKIRASEGKIKVGNVLIDTAKHKVMVSGENVDLTATEFKLLEFLSSRPGRVFSRDKILESVFGYDSLVYDRTVDAHIKSLRKKLGEARDYVETIRGIGYRFKE